MTGAGGCETTLTPRFDERVATGAEKRAVAELAMEETELAAAGALSGMMTSTRTLTLPAETES